MKVRKRQRSKLQRTKQNHGIKPSLHKRPPRLKTGVKK